MHSQNTSSSRRAPSSSTFIHPPKVPLVTGSVQSQAVAMFVLSILEFEWALNLNLISNFDVFPRSLEGIHHLRYSPHAAVRLGLFFIAR